MMIAGVAAFGSVGTAHAQTAPSLTDQITVLANRLPADTRSDVYEAQFAGLIDRQGATCTQVRDAAAQTTDLPRVAFVALRKLSSTLSACSGTAAIGGMRANNVAVPGFSVGGGSDYVR